jgi:FkbM family methyltransferase
MKKIRKLLNGYLSKIVKNPYTIVNDTLAGVPLKAIKGTFRKDPDQDDAWLFYLMGQSKRIFDIGSNIGLSALFAKVQGRDKRILLVDPNSEALALAARNLIMNDFSLHCEFVKSFVSDRQDEEVEFFTVGSGAAGSMYRSHAQTAAAIGASFRTGTTTIDALAENIGWMPDFVKIDVEGAEAKVLHGAQVVASVHKPIFMVEMHSPSELPMIENARLVLEWTAHVNYRAWYMRDAIQLTKPEIIGSRGKCHLLLLPANQTYPAVLSSIKQGADLPNIMC